MQKCNSCGANVYIKHDIAFECAYCGRLTLISPVFLHPEVKNDKLFKNHSLFKKLLQQNKLFNI